MLELCCRYLNQSFKTAASLSAVPPEAYVITDLNAVSRSKHCFISPQEILHVFSRLFLEDEQLNGTYDRHGRLEGLSMAAQFMTPSFHLLAARIAGGLNLSAEKSGPIFFLTHDVDKITNREPVAMAGMSVRAAAAALRGDLKTAKINAKALSDAARGRNTFWNFEEIMRLEADMGFRSSFYFLLGRKGVKGSKYSLDAVRDIIRELYSGGWEIGIHVNYYEYDQPERIAAQKKSIEDLIGDRIYGARVHWLRFDPKKTFSVLESSGFAYDCTLGSHDMCGYRTGTAYPYYPYNPELQGPMRLLEIPLLVMDVTLFEYMKLGAEEAWAAVKTLFEEWKDRKAVICVLWHTNVFTDPMFEGWSEVYKRILQYIKSSGCPVMTGKDICEAYRTGLL